ALARSLRLFFFSSRRRHTRFSRDWSSDVCSSDLERTDDAPATQQTDPGEQFTETVASLKKSLIVAFALAIPLFILEMGGHVFPRSEERRVGKECRCGWAWGALKREGCVVG